MLLTVGCRDTCSIVITVLYFPSSCIRCYLFQNSFYLLLFAENIFKSGSKGAGSDSADHQRRPGIVSFMMCWVQVRQRPIEVRQRPVEVAQVEAH